MKIFYLKLEPRSASALCFLTKSPSAQPEVTSDSFFLLRCSLALRSALCHRLGQSDFGRPEPELLCRSFVRAIFVDDGRRCKHEKTHTRLHMAQSSRCARDREQQAVDVLALEKNLRGLTWFRTPLEQAGLLSRRGIASARQMVAVSPQERSCEDIRL